MVWKSPASSYNFLVTSWRLPRNICYWEVTGKLVPVEFELYHAVSKQLKPLVTLETSLQLCRSVSGARRPRSFAAFPAARRSSSALVFRWRLWIVIASNVPFQPWYITRGFRFGEFGVHCSLMAFVSEQVRVTNFWLDNKSRGTLHSLLAPVKS